MAEVTTPPIEVRGIDAGTGAGRWRVKTANGFHVEVMPMAVNWRLHTVRVDTGDPMEWSDRYWCYAGRGRDTFTAAVLAAHAWDVAGDTEPVGWVKSWDGRRDGEGPCKTKR